MNEKLLAISVFLLALAQPQLLLASPDPGCGSGDADTGRGCPFQLETALAGGLGWGGPKLARDFGIPVFVSQKSESWELLGPRNAGGSVRALGIDHRNSRVLLCGALGGGIYRSSDRGEKWFGTDAPSHGRISSLVQDTRKGRGNTWYATTGGLSTLSTRYTLGEGLLKSSDNGRTWEVILRADASGIDLSGKPFAVIHSAGIHPETGDIYLAALDGIYRSRDEGASFQQVLAGVPLSMESVAVELAGYSQIHIGGGEVLYASVSQVRDPGTGSHGPHSVSTRFFESPSGALGEWTEITPDFIATNLTRVVIASAPSDPSRVYFAVSFRDQALAASLGRDCNLYLLTRDSGSLAWTDLSDNLPSEFNELRGGTLSGGGYNLALSVHPDDPEEVFLGLQGLFRSDNGFQSPHQMFADRYFDSYRVVRRGIHGVAFDPSDSRIMYVVGDGGVNKTLDSNWIQRVFPGEKTNLDNYFTLNNRGLSIAEVNDISLMGPDYVVATTLGQAAWVGAGGSSSWSIYEPGKVELVSSSSDGLYTALKVSGGRPNVFFRNIDPEFATVNEPYRSHLTGYLGLVSRFDAGDIHKLIGVEGPRVVIIEDMGLYLSDKTSHPPRQLDVRGRFLDSIMELTGYPETSLYGFTSGGSAEFGEPAVAPEFVVVTALGSDEPAVAFTSSEAFAHARVSDIFANPYDGRKILASFRTFRQDTKIIYSEDGGSSWVNVTGNLAPDGRNQGPLVLCLGIVGDNFMFLAGTTSGLLATRNLYGANTVWKRESVEGIKNWPVSDIEVDRGRRVTVGTLGGGVHQAVYASTPSWVHFRRRPENLVLRAGDLAQIDITDYVQGTVASMEAVGSRDDLFEVEVRGRTLRITAKREEGVGAVKVVVHAAKEGSGAVSGFGIRVHQGEGVVQEEMSYTVEQATASFLSGKVKVRNVGDFEFSILGYSVSATLNLETREFPYPVAPGGFQELRFFHDPQQSAEPRTRMVLEISQRPFVLTLDMDLAAFLPQVAKEQEVEIPPPGVGPLDPSGALESDRGLRPAGEVVVFPNPFDREASISLSDGSGDVWVRIYDMSGCSLLETRISGRGGPLELAFLPCGTYVVLFWGPGISPGTQTIVRR